MDFEKGLTGNGVGKRKGEKDGEDRYGMMERKRGKSRFWGRKN